MGRPSDARQRLIEAARDVIFARTYEGASVEDLCAAAGVNKSSFYHFFPSKQALVLAAIDSQWQWFEATVLAPIFQSDIAPQDRLLRFFDQTCERQRDEKASTGHMRGCPAGNLTLEMSAQDALIGARVERFFREWLGYFERMLDDAKARGMVPAALDTAMTAQALLAYFEGVMLLAKGRNDPALVHRLRNGALALIGYRSASGESDSIGH